MRRILILLAAAVLVAGCESEPTPPPTPDPGPQPPSGGERISGNERLGWNQQAASGEELSTFRYLIYVDTSAADAQDVACSATAGPAGFACTARMPSMSGGLHALTMSSYIDSGGSRLESPRSPAVNVFLVTQTTAGAGSVPADTASPGPMTTADGVRLFSETVVDGLDDATDLAFSADGRILVAERGGRIRVVRGRRLVATPAVTLADVDVSKGGGLLSIATDPGEQPRAVYALYTSSTGFRLARFRLVGDTLGDRAILLDEIPASPKGASGFVRVGPDGRLYVGFDDGGDARRSGDMGSFNGKILRLNPDATTPGDRSPASPVYAANMTAPRGAGWSAAATLWVVDVSPGVAGSIQAVRPNGEPALRYRLPDRAVPTAIAVFEADKPTAFQGNVFVAAGDRSLLRLVPDANDRTKIASTERLRDESFDGLVNVAIRNDGAIYLCTARTLLKLTPR